MTWAPLTASGSRVSSPGAARSQWLCSRFNAWEAELPFVDRLLDADVRNNSAWNHRHFALTQQRLLSSPAAVRLEVDAALRRLSLAVHNEAAWNFLLGLTACEGCGAEEVEWLERRIVAEVVQPHPHCPFPLSALVDLATHPLQGKEGAGEKRRKAREACEQLAVRLDPVRSSYWRMRREQLEAGEEGTSGERKEALGGSQHASAQTPTA